ncbi:MAG: HAD-IC family P-type ATPase [Lachnospiraceae bacterium]|nr:HAD-IC family P-type ATPase [Lachnospiraceae bacterium]
MQEEEKKHKKKDDNSTASIIKKNVFTYFNMIFAILSVMLILVKSWNSLTFLPVVIANTLIGIFQQLYAKKVLDNLNLMAEVKQKIIRSGEEMEVPAEELMRGDILILEGGQQIPADATVVDGTITVNESLLTGESDELDKNPGMSLMSGSVIISGKCRARADQVGDDAYIAKLTARAKQMQDKQSEMVRAIDRIVLVAGIAIIPVGAILLYQAVGVNGLTWEQGIVSMVGAVIGMIPEGLYLLVTIALAMAAARLAMNKVLLHDMRSTEALARVDVLCVDKTGTITSNEMNVEEVFYPDDMTPEDQEESRALLASYTSTTTDNNITAIALRNHFPEAAKFENASVTGFSSKTKYSEISVGERIFRLGAPEFVLSENAFENVRPLIEERTGAGKRVLVFARKMEEEFAPLAFVSLENDLRPNVEETFRYLAEQEVRVMVISGDNPRTVSEIAGKAGIPGAENYVDAETLTSEEDIKNAVGEYTVFGRVKPDQKKEIVTALKSQGSKVAMTGDGVNDILAMKEADCSIAMGAGSEAAMQVAQVVLLDSDFSHMKQIIGEGRQIINNITRSASLFLYKNIFSLLLAIFSIVNFLTYPLKPSQISLVSMFNIGVPAFLLALETNEKKQKGKFISVVFLNSIPAALTSFFSIAALVLFAQMFHIDHTDVGVASCFLLSIVGFMILWKLCEPLNWYRAAVFFGCALGFILGATRFSDLFSIQYITEECLALAAVFAIAQESVLRNLTRLITWIARKHADERKKHKERQMERAKKKEEKALAKAEKIEAKAQAKAEKLRRKAEK